MGYVWEVVLNCTHTSLVCKCQKENITPAHLMECEVLNDNRQEILRGTQIQDVMSNPTAYIWQILKLMTRCDKVAASITLRDWLSEHPNCDLRTEVEETHEDDADNDVEEEQAKMLIQLDQYNNAMLIAETMSDDEDIEEARRQHLFLRQNEDD